MTKEEALNMLYEGDLYDAFGYVTAYGYKALEALDGVVLQERKTGKWIEKNEMYICTACENRLSKLVVYDVGGIYNYCPNCGARMEAAE